MDVHELNDVDRALATVNLALSARPDPTDVADPEAAILLSDRGRLHLDRYRVTGARADLDRAIADLTLFSADADWPYWCQQIGEAPLARMSATAGEATDDEVVVPRLIGLMELGITWLERAFSAVNQPAENQPAVDQPAVDHRGVDHRGVDRNLLANDLAELHRQLYAHRGDGPDRLARADRLILNLHRLRVPASDELRHDVWRMHLGAAYEDRFDFTGNRADLDLAIELLSSTVDRLPIGVLLLPDAYEALARAYQARHDLDGDAASLDRLVEVAGQGARRSVRDPYSRRRLRWYQFQGLRQRHERTGDNADRDRAIAVMRVAMADHAGLEPDAGVDAGEAAELADLLLERGRDRLCEDDLLAAANWYAVAADRTPDDDELKWRLHLQTAQSYQWHRLLSDSIHYLVPMMEALTAALTLGVPDPDLRLAAHGQRVQAFDALCDHRIAR